MTKPVLPIKNLSDRHPGITPALAECYLEAARVCLDRHHQSPREVIVIDNANRIVIAIEWEKSDQRTRNAWANAEDTTEAGAYCVALAHAEITRGLVAVHRAQSRTGVDYYLGDASEQVNDLEACMRLEVSGTDQRDSSVIRHRLIQKQDQARRVASHLPALATVVAFAVLRIESADVQSK